MSRLQLAINVDDLETSIDFYRRLFATEPAMRTSPSPNRP